jgi:type I restriction enzyme, S subunit
VSAWPSVRLDAVAKVIRGVTYAKGDVLQAPADGDIPVLRAGNINGRLILDHDLVWLSKNSVSKDQFLQRNDIVMCMSSGSACIVGKSALLNRDWIGSFGAFCAAVRANKAKAEPGFLAHVFQSTGFRKWASAAQGNNIKNLNKSALEGYVFPTPPLDEQRRIVAQLDRAADIRRRAEAARAKARAIIPALFLDTFGDPATNPKGWPVLSFSAVVENFRYGTNQKCSEEQIDGAIPVLRIPNVIGATINWHDLKYAVLSDAEVRKLNLSPGDLLFVRTNGNPDYIGRCAEYRGERRTAYASYLIRARLSEAMSSTFVCQHFTHSNFRPTVLRAGRTTAGNYNLSTEGLGKLPLIAPPLALQTDFAEQVQRIEVLACSLDAAAVKADSMAAALSVEVFE